MRSPFGVAQLRMVPRVPQGVTLLYWLISHARVGKQSSITLHVHITLRLLDTAAMILRAGYRWS